MPRLGGCKEEKATEVGHKIQPLVFLGRLLPLKVHRPCELGKHGLMGTQQVFLCRCMWMVVPLSSGHVPFRWSLVQVYRAWLCHLRGLRWQKVSPLQGEFSLAATHAEQKADKAQVWYHSRSIDVS